MLDFLKSISSDFIHVLKAPVINVLILSGIVFITISFVDYDKYTGIVVKGQFHVYPATIGVVILIVGVVLFIKIRNGKQKSGHIDYIKNKEIKVGDLVVEFKVGELQLVSTLSKNEAIVLPANSTFDDDCVTDKNSALGSYFLEHFPDQTTLLPGIIRETLSKHGLVKYEDGKYPAGTTLLLPENFSKPARIVITASTIRTDEAGISANPKTICNCVEGIIKCTVNHRINTIYMPIIGSGHGGLEKGMALLFLALSWLHYSKKHHHIKRVIIIVHPSSEKEINESVVLNQIVQ